MYECEHFKKKKSFTLPAAKMSVEMKLIVTCQLLIIMMLVSPVYALGDEIIYGHYCYTYGDKESVKEARETARALAIRDAIESNQIFIVSKTHVKDFKLTNDLIQTIVSGHIKNIKVIEHTETSRTICDKIEAHINPTTIEKLILENDTGQNNEGNTIINNLRLDWGKWTIQEHNHQYPYVRDADWKKLPNNIKKMIPPPAPCPAENKLCWSRVKEIGRIPEEFNKGLVLYSVIVIESSYAFLEVTTRMINNIEYDVLKWGWKIKLKNNSRKGICAYTGYALYDENNFLLSKTDEKDWDNDTQGIFLKPRGTKDLKGTAQWLIEKKSYPYPAKRVHYGDYKLFLRNADFFDEIADE